MSQSLTAYPKTDHLTPTASRERTRVAYVFTVALSIGMIRGSVPHLIEQGFDVSVISSAGWELDAVRQEGATTYALEMKRHPSPAKDLWCVWALIRLFRRIRPDVTNVGTPKAGLLGGLAAVMARVPYRVYTLHGLRLETVRGPKRLLLWFFEWVACRCAHRVNCVSPTLLERARAMRLVSKRRSTVLGAGSLNGIHIEQYAATSEHQEATTLLRRKLRLSAGALVIGFVGRLTKDKGVGELYQAFVSIVEQFPEARLLLVGQYEEGDPVPAEVRLRIDQDRRVVVTGWLHTVHPYYRVMDVFGFPSHREGLPTVLLEAQASSVPIAATCATGMRDAMVDGETGFLTPVGDVPALTESLRTLLADKALRRKMGEAGQKFVAEKFGSVIVWQRLEAEYRRGLHSRKGADHGLRTDVRDVHA
ncbi:MAG: glycosyltransferase family 4 protein [Acidobacteriota bacterium]|nr:glycosyltransferase family 4 protein [Acidobacteriota bacterium]